jgi:hypothetical protein
MQKRRYTIQYICVSGALHLRACVINLGVRVSVCGSGVSECVKVEVSGGLCVHSVCEACELTVSELNVNGGVSVSACVRTIHLVLNPNPNPNLTLTLTPTLAPNPNPNPNPTPNPNLLTLTLNLNSNPLSYLLAPQPLVADRTMVVPVRLLKLNWRGDLRHGGAWR